MNDLIKFIHGNVLISGGIGLAVGAWFWRNISEHLSSLRRVIFRLFTTSVIIYSEDEFIFNAMDAWIANHPKSKNIRELLIRKIRDVDTQSSITVRFHLLPGEGYHLYFNWLKTFWITRNIADNQSMQINSYTDIRKQTVRLTCLGRDKSIIESILEEAKRRYSGKGIELSVWSGQEYRAAGSRPYRSVDTIYMDSGKKKELLGSLNQFFKNKGYYQKNGIPWKMGLMFEGPPGTGKTSLIFTLASLYKKNICIIPPSSIKSDESFLIAMNKAGNDFIVIEDIDSLQTTESRDINVKSKDNDNPISSLFGPTLSGLLNGIDGISSQEGRVLFITTNCSDKLDEALIRPGRIDHKVYLDKATKEIAIDMCTHLCKNDNWKQWIEEIKFPVSQATIQQKILEHNNDN